MSQNLWYHEKTNKKDIATYQKAQVLFPFMEAIKEVKVHTVKHVSMASIRASVPCSCNGRKLTDLLGLWNYYYLL